MQQLQSGQEEGRGGHSSLCSPLGAVVSGCTSSEPPLNPHSSSSSLRDADLSRLKSRWSRLGLGWSRLRSASSRSGSVVGLAEGVAVSASSELKLADRNSSWVTCCVSLASPARERKQFLPSRRA